MKVPFGGDAYDFRPWNVSNGPELAPADRLEAMLIEQLDHVG
jgi:hypothetical protein